MRLRRGLIGPMSSLGIQNRHGSSEEDSKGGSKGSDDVVWSTHPASGLAF